MAKKLVVQFCNSAGGVDEEVIYRITGQTDRFVASVNEGGQRFVFMRASVIDRMTDEYGDYLIVRGIPDVACQSFGDGTFYRTPDGGFKWFIPSGTLRS